jgi:hypothetical protein
VDDRLAIVVVQVKLARRGLNGSLGNLALDARNARIQVNLGAGLGQQLERFVVVNAHARIHQQGIAFVNHLGNGRVIEQVEFGSHAFVLLEED